MPEVFISYARGDARTFVAELAAALERHGVDVWVDLEDIPPASQWREELTEALTASDALAYVISPAAVASPYCANELDQALGQNKRIVPVRLELPPDPAAIPPSVEAANWIPSDSAFDPANTTHVDALVDAIRTDRDWVRQHTRLSVQAAEWQASESDRALLLRGSEMGAAEDWLDRATGKDPAPTEAQRLFVSASRRAGRRRTRTLIAGMAIALVVTAGLAAVALQQRSQAQQRADEARAGQLASEAETVASSDPELALILARAATAIDPSSTQAQQQLRTAIGTSLVRARIEPPGPTQVAAGPNAGDPVAVATANGVILWDAASADTGPVALKSPSPLTAVAYNNDGSLIATGDDHGTITIWRATDRAEVVDWSASTKPIRALDFNRAGLLAEGGEDGTVRIWDPTDQRLKQVLDDPGDIVHDVDWSTDGARLVSADDIGLATVWNAENGRSKVVYHDNNPLDIFSAQFSPDGRTVLSAGADVSARLWNSHTGQDVVAFATYASPATGADFALGSDLVLVSSLDGRTIVYERRHRRALLQLSGHKGAVESMAVLAGSRRLVTVGVDGTVRSWQLVEDNADRLPPSGVGQIALAQDGDHAAYASGRKVYLRTLDGPVNSDETVAKFADPVGKVAISSDGSLIAAATQAPGASSSLVSVVAADNGHVISRSSLPNAPLERLAFTGPKDLFVMTKKIGAIADPHTGQVLAGMRAPNGQAWLDGEARPDGSQFILASPAGVVEVSGADGSVVAQHPLTSRVNGVAYSPDGSQFATAADDGSVTLYQAGSTGDGRAVLQHSATASDVAFSSDGRYLASVGLDGRIRLYDLEAGRTAGSIVDIGGFSFELEFAPTDDRLLTIGDQALLRPCDVCGLDLAGLQALADQRITRDPTAEERERYGLD